MEQEQDGIRVLDLVDAIALRPAMYFGSRSARGVRYLFRELFSELLFLLKTEQTEFDVTSYGAGRFKIKIEGSIGKDLLASILEEKGNAYLLFMVAASQSCTFFTTDTDPRLHFIRGKLVGGSLAEWTDCLPTLNIEFELRSDIFTDFPVYSDLFRLFNSLAMLNHNSTFHLNDGQNPSANKNEFRYPEGLQQQFNTNWNNVSRAFPITFFRSSVKGNYYEIGIAACASNWYGDQLTFSWARNQTTKEHGSLVEGIVAGVRAAFTKLNKERTKDDKQVFPSRTSKSYKEKLLIVCLVKTVDDQYRWAGSTKWMLNMPEIEKTAKKLVCAEVLLQMRQNPKLVAQLESIFMNR